MSNHPPVESPNEDSDGENGERNDTPNDHPHIVLLDANSAPAANFASPAIWGDGIPNYFAFGGPDLILNVPDVLMIVAGIVNVVSMGRELMRRGSARRPLPSRG